MVLPYCQDICELNNVNEGEMIVRQDTFLYAITGDIVFLGDSSEDYEKMQREKFSNFIEILKKLNHNSSGDFFERLPRPLGMASLWWNALAFNLNQKYPNVFLNAKDRTD